MPYRCIVWKLERFLTILHIHTLHQLIGACHARSSVTTTICCKYLQKITFVSKEFSKDFVWSSIIICFNCLRIVDQYDSIREEGTSRMLKPNLENLEGVIGDPHMFWAYLPGCLEHTVSLEGSNCLTSSLACGNIFPISLQVRRMVLYRTTSSGTSLTMSQNSVKY